MTHPKLGNKHVCKDCDTRFFDMKKTLPVCPKCGLEIKGPKQAKGKRAAVEAAAISSVPPAKKATPKTAKGDGDEDIDDELADLLPADDSEVDNANDDDDDDDDDDELIEDTSDLGEDDDDLLEVREHIDVETTDKG